MTRKSSTKTLARSLQHDHGLRYQTALRLAQLTPGQRAVELQAMRADAVRRGAVEMRDDAAGRDVVLPVGWRLAEGRAGDVVRDEPDALGRSWRVALAGPRGRWFPQHRSPGSDWQGVRERGGRRKPVQFGGVLAAIARVERLVRKAEHRA